MAWSLYRWSWRLEAPLHIGMAPAGMLNRTRLYVPARSIWGALTAELARSNNEFPNYHQIGEAIKREIRFSYLYPAEEVNGEWKAWLPSYQEGKELMWEREDGIEGQRDREFRMRLLSARPGTAVSPQSDTAQDGTLHEFELIGPYWREARSATVRPVGLVGYVFFVNPGQGLYSRISEKKLLFIGGDTKYGLGRIRLVNCQLASNFFGYHVDLSQDDPVVRASRVLAHASYSTANMLKGQYEIAAGWDYNDQLQPNSKLLWQPGSKSDQEQNWKISDNGYWTM